MARVFVLAEAERIRRIYQPLNQYRRQVRETSLPMSLPDTEFIRHFRMERWQFEEICQEIVPFLPQSQRTHAIRPDLKILASLNFYATGSYQRAVGANFLLGISQPCMSECLAEVTEALNHPTITRKYMKFPSNPFERNNIMRRFMEQNHFPGVIGCIDGTHIAIIRPHELEEAYFNRKHYHSINALVICDADLQILYVDASFGGSSHDSHIWNNCPVQQLLQQLHRDNQTCWLLGDSAYALRPYMLTPILHVDPESPEGNYTARHVQTRNTVERCFGVLKSRFRCLLAHRVMHYHPIKAGKIVNACVVLHNFIRNHDTVVIDTEEMARDLARQPLVPRANFLGEVEDINIREAVVARLWRHR